MIVSEQTIHNKETGWYLINFRADLSQQSVVRCEEKLNGVNLIYELSID